jgi:hypothetical protein
MRQIFFAWRKMILLRPTRHGSLLLPRCGSIQRTGAEHDDVGWSAILIKADPAQIKSTASTRLAFTPDGV